MRRPGIEWPDMAHIGELSVQSRERTEFIKLEGEIAKIVADSGVRDGICHVYVLHTTAGVMINEGADPSVVHDIGAKLAELAPREGHYAHADAEPKSVRRGDAPGAHRWQVGMRRRFP